MGTVPRPKIAGSALPPPPAPTSSDANPWPISGSRASVPPRLPGLRVNPVKISERLKVPPVTAARLPKPASAVPSPAPAQLAKAPARISLVPFAILGAVLIAVGSNALESFQQGNYFDALFPLVIVAFIGTGAVRAMWRKRS